MPFGDDLLAMIKAVKEQTPVKRANCPECDYPLEELEDGSLHCPFCGFTEVIRSKK